MASNDLYLLSTSRLQVWTSFSTVFFIVTLTLTTSTRNATYECIFYNKLACVQCILVTHKVLLKPLCPNFLDGIACIPTYKSKEQ